MINTDVTTLAHAVQIANLKRALRDLLDAATTYMYSSEIMEDETRPPLVEAMETAKQLLGEKTDEQPID